MIYSSTSVYGPHIFRVKENGETIQGDIRDARWTYLINKLASLPAQFLGMKDRGFLLEGFKADIAVFDPQTVRDNAIYDNASIMYTVLNLLS